MKERRARVILNAVAFASSENISTREGLARVQEYLYGLGRFGNSAFLCCMYGIGELPKAFVALAP